MVVRNLLVEDGQYRIRTGRESSLSAALCRLRIAHPPADSCGLLRITRVALNNMQSPRPRLYVSWSFTTTTTYDNHDKYRDIDRQTNLPFPISSFYDRLCC
jgi:hypothetical protein